MEEMKEMSGNYLTTLCRICAKNSDSIFDLFSSEHNGKKLNEMLEFCVKQMIHRDDGLPGIICACCKSNLIVAYTFHALYSDSDQLFRRIVGTSSRVKVEMDFEPESQIKVENDIVVLPDISYFRNDHFETNNLDNLNMVEDDSDNSGLYFKLNSTHVSPRKSTKLYKSKKLAEKQKKSAERLKIEFFECFQCKKNFRKIRGLQRHMKVHAVKTKPYRCTECAMKFVYLKSLFRHRRHKHSTRVYECEYCTEAFQSLSKLKQHVTGTHKNELRTYKCDSCTKTFLLSFQLSCHQTEDLCSLSFSCSTCGDSFPLHRMLKTHIRDKHTNHLCAECGKTFKTVHLLASHQNLHKSDTPFACSQCPNRFKWKAALTTHMLVHTGQKKHVCDICGSLFTTKGSLNKHHLIHTGTRPFPCETCSMRFYSKDHLKRHIRTHSGEKPYKCKYCDRAFSQSNDLTKHTRSHVGQNMYKCPDCPKAFRLQTELRNHSYEHYEASKGIQESN